MNNLAFIKNEPNRYFHVTETKSLKSILKKGLKPQMGPRSLAIGEDQPKIYLFSKIEELDNALMNWLGEEFEDGWDLAILQVDLPETFPVDTAIDDNGVPMWESTSSQPIEPKFITEIYDEYYMPMKGIYQCQHPVA